MLPKKNRADKKTINEIWSGGRFLNSSSLSLKYVLEARGTPRVSVIVPKSVARLATKRNSLRRSGYRALERNIALMPPGLRGALLFKKYQDDPQILQNEIETIFHKIN